MHLQKLLEQQNYDTIENFIKFYETYQKSEYEDVLEFFQAYEPQISPKYYTCVGLALELWKVLGISLEKKYPGIGEHICVVSCEEDIGNASGYVGQNVEDSACYKFEKEHVLMCLKFEFSGRSGTLLCDPGYHVGRIVTVMSDESYPHTGWFVQSEENGISKEYSYALVPNFPSFVEWKERTINQGNEKKYTGLIYTGKPYLTSVDVTERRNLVYSFRSLLSRNPKGKLIAGIFFKVLMNNDEFTMFYQNMGKQRIKLRFSDFLQSEIDQDLLEKVAICNEQLNLPKGKLLSIIIKSGHILKDVEFLPDVLGINKRINTMAENN